MVNSGLRWQFAFIFQSAILFPLAIAIFFVPRKLLNVRGAQRLIGSPQKPRVKCADASVTTALSKAALAEAEQAKGVPSPTSLQGVLHHSSHHDVRVFSSLAEGGILADGDQTYNQLHEPDETMDETMDESREGSPLSVADPALLVTLSPDTATSPVVQRTAAIETPIKNIGSAVMAVGGKQDPPSIMMAVSSNGFRADKKADSVVFFSKDLEKRVEATVAGLNCSDSVKKAKVQDRPRMRRFSSRSAPNSPMDRSSIDTEGLCTVSPTGSLDDATLQRSAQVSRLGIRSTPSLAYTQQLLNHHSFNTAS
jgi:hypothetical protein